MAKTQNLRIHLDRELLARVRAGKHNFLNHVIGAFEDIGWRVRLLPDSDRAILREAEKPGHSLFHMSIPVQSEGLIFRRAYVYPFWKIEQTGTRWAFDCVERRFDPSAIAPEAARRFADQVCRRELRWAAARRAEDFIYIPLQGQLLNARAHQAVSPIDMVRSTITYFADDKIRITQHPRESYSSEELDALKAAIADHPNCRVIRKGPEDLLARAKLVVTQNSSVAFLGAFLKKPAVLFAASDFHHLFPNVKGTSPDAAFEAALTQDFAYAEYLYWFLQLQSINAGRDDVRDRVIARVSQLGWPVTERKRGA